MATAIIAALIGASAIVAGVVAAEWLRRRWERHQRARALFLSVSNNVNLVVAGLAARRPLDGELFERYVQSLVDLVDLLALCEAERAKRRSGAFDGLLEVYDRWSALPHVPMESVPTVGVANALAAGMERARPLLWKHPPTISDRQARAQAVKYLVEHGLDAPLPPPESGTSSHATTP